MRVRKAPPTFAFDFHVAEFRSKTGFMQRTYWQGLGACCPMGVVPFCWNATMFGRRLFFVSPVILEETEEAVFVKVIEIPAVQLLFQLGCLLFGFCAGQLME